MKDLQIRLPKLSAKSVTHSALLTFLLTSLSLLAVAQQTQPRGLYPTGTFDFSDVDIINATTGNLTVRYPLGSLPPGRGEVRAGFALYYNSKLFDSYLNNGLNDGSGPYSADVLSTSQQGGWHFGYEYKLQVYIRPNAAFYQPCTTIGATDIFRVVITYPDGSDHEFRPWGYNSGLGDGYYAISPSGNLNVCPPGHVANSMTYYSTDGTFTRLEIDASNPTSDYSILPWKMFLPDGSKVTKNEVVNGNYTYQRFYDRNNNRVEIKPVTLNNHPAIKIVDELNREVVLEYSGGSSGGTTITSPAPNNQTVVWEVVGRSISPTGFYTTYGSDGNPHNFDFPGSSGVAQITAPTQAGGLTTTFTYDSENGGSGAGELKEMILPSSAKVTYTFKYGAACTGCAPDLPNVLQCFVSRDSVKCCGNWFPA